MSLHRDRFARRQAADPAADDRLAACDGISNALAIGNRFVTRVAGTPDQIAVCRREVDRVLGRDHPLREDVRLLVTELVTNSIRHSRSGRPGGQLVLSLVVSRHRVRAKVRDAGSPSHTPHVADAGTEAVGGRGLALVDRLADRWAICPETNSVWFEIDLPKTDRT